MFGWFKKKSAQLDPESRWIVGSEGLFITVSDEAAQTRSVAKTDLSGVAIETNDSGPWGADVWWLLFGNDDRLACLFPQGATGEKAVVEYLTELPSFDHGEMIKAMTSTENTVFPVWRKSA